MITKTLYDLHIQKNGQKFSHVVSFILNYINIVNSSKYFLPEPVEIKSCIHRVEATKAGVGL